MTLLTPPQTFLHLHMYIFLTSRSLWVVYIYPGEVNTRNRGSRIYVLVDSPTGGEGAVREISTLWPRAGTQFGVFSR